MGEIVRWPPPRECSFFAAEANNPSITAPLSPPAVFKGGGDGSGGGKKAPAAAAAASIIQDTRTTSKGARERGVLPSQINRITKKRIEMLPKLKLKPLPVIISPRPFHSIPFLSPFTQDSFFRSPSWWSSSSSDRRRPHSPASVSVMSDALIMSGIDGAFGGGGGGGGGRYAGCRSGSRSRSIPR